MNNPLRFTKLLLIAALVPVSVYADGVVMSDVGVTASATFSSQRVTPEKRSSDTKTVSPDQVLQSARALEKDGLPFPNVPNSQNSGFASSTATVSGVFGVGVNGLHLENSLPPNRYLASGRWTQTLTNDSTVTQLSSGRIIIPAPTIQLFGVGDFFPAGANPELDAVAQVQYSFTTRLTHADGSVVETILFDYGMHTFRDKFGGELLANATGDALGMLSRFDEFDGSFGFRLPQVVRDFFSAVLRPVRVWSLALTISPQPARASAKPPSLPQSAIPST